jgi:hypothetical protein
MIAPVLQIPNQEDFDSEIERLEYLFKAQIGEYKDGDDPAKNRIARRKMQLMKTLRQQYALTHERRDTLFISLAGTQTRSVNGEESILDRVKRIAFDHGFINTLTGFDKDMNYIREDIFTKIHTCDAFLGIWTDDFIVKRKGASSDTFGPGVWMPLELGVALASNKECRLLLQKDLTPELLSPVANIVQRWFTASDFDSRTQEAIAILRKEVGNPRP